MATKRVALRQGTPAKKPEAQKRKSPGPKDRPAKGALPRGTQRVKGATEKPSIERRLVRATDALKKEFEKVRAMIARLRGTGSEAFDDLYEEVGRVLESDPPLYAGGGYRTKEDFIQAELPGETLRSVQRNVLVARSFSPQDEARHGIGFLEEVALYAKELAGAAEPPRAINLDKLIVTLRDKRSASVRKKAREASIDDIRKARRGLRSGVQTKKAASPVDAAIRAALGKNKALSQIAVRTGREVVSFGDVPLAALGAFAKALGTTKLPEA